MNPLEAFRRDHGPNEGDIAQTTDHLNPYERRALQSLERVTTSVERLYQRQKETPFYPEDATKEEILELGERDETITSPETYVERKNGQLVAIPFHKKFQKESKEAASAARDASKAIDDPESKELFEALATAFVQGKWSEFEVAWLTQSWQPNIDVFAGPFEPHMDKLLGKKHVFEIYVGQIDRAETDKVRRLVERAQDVSGRESSSLPRIQVRVDQALQLGGLLKELGANAFTMPNDPEVGREHGYKIVFFKDRIEQTFKRQILPVIQTIFEDGLVKKYEPIDASFLEAYQYWLALHEASHPLVQHTSKKGRFLEYHAPMDEFHCDVNALNLASELRERYLISPQLFERILMVHVANKFVDYGRFYLLGVEEKEAYARGSVVELNYLFEHAAFEPNEYTQFGLYRENAIVETSKDLLGLLDIHTRNGRYSDVKTLFSRYSNRTSLRRFDENIRRALNGSVDKPEFSI